MPINVQSRQATCQSMYHQYTEYTAICSSMYRVDRPHARQYTEYTGHMPVNTPSTQATRPSMYRVDRPLPSMYRVDNPYTLQCTKWMGHMSINVQATWLCPSMHQHIGIHRRHIQSRWASYLPRHATCL